MNVPVRCIAASLVLVLTAAAAQPVAEQAAAPAASAPDPAASSPSVLHSIGSFLSNLKPGAKEPVAAGAEAAAATPDKGAAFSVVDIQSWSKTADVVLDPECKTLVQPFGLTDSVASLGMLAVKTNLQAFLARLNSGGQQPLKTGEVIRLAARGLNWLPTEVELRIGEALVPDADILDENKNAESRRVYQKARTMLADIVANLPQPLPYQFRVLVRTTSEGNASALPGGIILADRDLFGKDAPAEFTYFVMSHEVAHVLQRHQTRAYQAQLVDGVTTLQDLGKFLEKARQPDVGAVVSYATALKKTVVKFSEQQELQADSCAIRMLAQRQPDAAVMEQRLRAIEKHLGPASAEVADGPAGNQLADHMKYLGNGVLERHPNSSQRRANLYVAFHAVRQGPPHPR